MYRACLVLYRTAAYVYPRGIDEDGAVICYPMVPTAWSQRPINLSGEHNKKTFKNKSLIITLAGPWGLETVGSYRQMNSHLFLPVQISKKPTWLSG